MTILDSRLSTRETDVCETPYRVPVSVIVPVKNEANNLRRCLPALEWADEVEPSSAAEKEALQQVLH